MSRDSHNLEMNPLPPCHIVVNCPSDECEEEQSVIPSPDHHTEDDVHRNMTSARPRPRSVSNQILRNPTLRITPQSSGLLSPALKSPSRVSSSSHLSEKAPLIPVQSQGSGTKYALHQYGTGGESSLEASSPRFDRREPSSVFNKVSQASKSFESNKLFKTLKELGSKLKTTIIFIIVVVCSITIASVPEHERNFRDISVSDGEPKELSLPWPLDTEEGSYGALSVQLRGAFLYPTSSKWDSKHANVTIMFQQILANSTMHTSYYRVTISLDDDDPAPESIITKTILIDSSRDAIDAGPLKLIFSTESNDNIPIAVESRFINPGFQYEILFASFILIFVYILICFELIHRALAAIIGSLMVVAVLSTFSLRPKLLTIISWIDFETLILLFGMMIIVSIFCETGIFDWIALQAYKIAKGRPWPLMIIFCLVSAFVSAFLDNVTTLLLLTPVTIRLCEVLRMDPRRLLIAEVIFSNIGGTATGIGDPPNVIIVSSALKDSGVTFSNLTFHMTLGILLVTIAAFGLLWYLYRDLGDSSQETYYEVVELCREIEVWRRTAYAIAIVTNEEATMRALLLQKVAKLEHELANIQNHHERRMVDYQATLSDLEKKYRITNVVLLVKCSIVLCIVIVTFFVSSFVQDRFHLDLSWVAFLGAVWLLVLADFAELDALLNRVEWTTLIFFAALFILMEGLELLGLISYIGEQIADVISSLPLSAQFPVAILLLLWVSAIASAFIDNIPYTTAMIPVVLRISQASDELDNSNIPLLPLVWALAFGACLGGNGTLIGASANVVAAGIAQQHGYSFSFKDFFKIGFPMMLWTVFVAMIYLLICHMVIGWNYS